MTKFVSVFMLFAGLGFILLAAYLAWDLTDYPNREYMASTISAAWDSTRGPLPVWVSARFPMLGDGYIGVYAPVVLAVLGTLFLVIGWRHLDHLAVHDEEEDEPEDPAREPIATPANDRPADAVASDRAA